MSTLMQPDFGGIVYVHWFDIKSGVRQGCARSGFLFLLVIDWVMRKTLRKGNTGIRWMFTEKLEDLDFTDDLALLSSTRRQLQLKNKRLSNASKGTGLKITITKTKVMRFDDASEEKVIVNGEELEDVDTLSTWGPKLVQLAEQMMTSLPDFVKQEQCLVNCQVSGKAAS